MAESSKRSKSLATRLFAIIFAVAFVSFAAATAITAYMSWTVYEGNAEDKLTTQLGMIAEELSGQSDDEMVVTLTSTQLADTRITLVAKDGTVLYDNYADASTMENHANRQEIEAAREGSESVVMRKSETTGVDTLYAATLASPSATVLRLAESRASLGFYLSNLILPISCALVLALLLSALIARAITRRITSPLIDVDLDAPLKSNTYREIKPLLSRIDTQKNELTAQNEELERAVAMRREFTGNVSHEMKSPLQVIGGYAELIEAGVASPEDTKRFAGLIRSESQSMRELIDDVLMLSRLDEGASDAASPVDVVAAASIVVDRLRSSAEAKGVEVTLSSLDKATVQGAESTLEQAIYNLVDNAIRYGGSRVAIRISSSDGKVRISVSDDGSGVPEDQRERIFERFYRIDHSRSRETGGTGLGLAIVKHAAESMGGAVSVETSELGGARFVLELPAAD